MKIKKWLLLGFFLISSFSFAAVNINTATVEQLSSLKGIGPTKAAEIVKYRDEHGDFKDVSDLAKVKGIGLTTLAKIKDQLSIKGKTKLKEVGEEAVEISKDKK